MNKIYSKKVKEFNLENTEQEFISLLLVIARMSVK